MNTIKNKKGFWGGVILLLIAGIDVLLLIVHHNDVDTMRIIKSVLITAFCLLLGVTQVYRSINSKCVKEDEQNDDERDKLVALKAESSTFKITFWFSIVLSILAAIALGVTKYNGLAGFYVE